MVILREWLNQGGDVNAMTYSAMMGGVTLLAAACERGQSQVVSGLLSYPALHLNTIHNLKHKRHCTPLWIAAHMGEEACVQLLLSSISKCVVNLGAVAETDNSQLLTPAMAAARNGYWAIVRLIFAANKNSGSDEAAFLLHTASATDQWNEVLVILERKFRLTAETYSPLVVRAYDQEEMDVVRYVLKDCFLHKNNCIYELILRAVNKENWSDVKEFFTYLDKEITFGEEQVQAALMGNSELIRNCTEQTRDGVRLVLAAAGANENVANKIFFKFYSSNQCVQEGTLLLSAMTGNLEVLVSVFRRHYTTFPYSVLSRARRLAAKAGHEDAVTFLQIALRKKAEYMS